MCAHNLLSLFKHLHVAVTLPYHIVKWKWLEWQFNYFHITPLRKIVSLYVCAHNRLPLLKHLRVLVTHLPDCHIEMGLPFEWQDNYSQITPLRKTRLNPHLWMSGHLFRFQSTHDHFIFLTIRRKWTSRTTVFGVWTRTQTIPTIYNANFTIFCHQYHSESLLSWMVRALWRGFWWLFCLLYCTCLHFDSAQLDTEITFAWLTFDFSLSLCSLWEFGK